MIGGYGFGGDLCHGPADGVGELPVLPGVGGSFSITLVSGGEPVSTPVGPVRIWRSIRSTGIDAP